MLKQTRLPVQAQRHFATPKFEPKSNIKFMFGGQLPIDVKGTTKLPKIPTRDLVGDFLDSKKITEELLCEHFLSMI